MELTAAARQVLAELERQSGPVEARELVRAGAAPSNMAAFQRLVELRGAGLVVAVGKRWAAAAERKPLA